MSRGALARLHIAKKEAGLDDETYRDLLERVTGQRTAAGLSDAQIGRVLDELRGLGWKPRPSAKPSGAPHVRKVWALWADLCRAGIPREPTRAALRSFVERQVGVADPEWLNPTQANHITEALKAWRRRAQGAPKP